MSRPAYFKSDGPMMEIKMWRLWRQYISPKCLMSHLYPNGPSNECSRSVATVTYAYSVMGILRVTNKKETDPTESQIVRASVLESHGWSSEPNRSQCKLRIQEINSPVFLLHFIFLFVRDTPFLYYVTRTCVSRRRRQCSVNFV